MSYSPASNFGLEVARGNVPGVSSINKFGHAVNGIQTTATDVWDRADATPTQQVWTAPTTARIHDITSTSTNDDGDPAGTGARTVKIFGLTAWSDTSETTETITMNGTSNVATSNSYVIIHRMTVETYGSAGPNVGTITATAQTDATVTAQISVGLGQTQMAIFGVPTGKSLFIEKFRASTSEALGGGGTQVELKIVYNPQPATDLSGFIQKESIDLNSTGTSAVEVTFNPPFQLVGPGIVKIRGVSSGADTDVSASFDGFIT